MTTKQKTILIHFVFILFAAFFLEILRAGNTGKFSVADWLLDSFIIAMLDWIIYGVRKLIG
jgi:hypothetical protein